MRLFVSLKIFLPASLYLIRLSFQTRSKEVMEDQKSLKDSLIWRNLSENFGLGTGRLVGYAVRIAQKQFNPFGLKPFLGGNLKNICT
jgi:hypothetical protein